MIHTKNKSKWQVCRELVKESQEVMEREKLLQDNINEVCLPLLTILEEDDVPVEKVWWEHTLKSIDLAEGICLPSETLKRIAEEFKIEEFNHEFRSSSSVIAFFEPVFFTIYNGEGFCKMKKAVKVITPAPREEEVWELDGPCAYIEALEEVIEEGKESS